MITVLSFGGFLLLFAGIGLLSKLKSEPTSIDYLLARHEVKPWLVGLSAVATNNSGYMFIGMIGFTYATGWSSVWLMVGWVLGDLLASLLVHKRLRAMTEKRDVRSFSGILAQWQGTDYLALRRLGGLIVVIFLGSYAAAQFNAGSKALHVLFGWDYSAGAIIGAALVLIYCFAGGIRASIWTDAAQSIVMILAMGTLLYVSVESLGGLSAFISKLDAVSPTYLDWFPPDLALQGWLGPLLFVAGWFGGGFGVAGQPHILIRFMAMDEANHINRARFYYYSWFIAFYAMAIGVGLAARLMLSNPESFDPELALPLLAQNLLPPIGVGIVLAGIFAATMSTADSLVLSCSASLTRDFVPDRFTGYLITKLATVVVIIGALGIALSQNESVFWLVLMSWSVLAAAFAPLLVVYARGGKPSERLALAMMISGVLTVFAWRALGWDAHIYEILPGMLVGFVTYAIARLLADRS